MATGTHEYLEDARNENVLIYVDGEIVRRPEAKVSVFDSGFLLGDGVWEGIRLHSGKLVFLEVHLDRLYSGAEQLAIDIGMSREELTALIHKTLDANGMTDHIHIRLIVSRGLKKTPYQHPSANVGGPTIVIIPEYKIASEAVLERGIRLGTVSVRRGTADTQDPRLNTLSKLNCIAACIVFALASACGCAWGEQAMRGSAAKQDRAKYSGARIMSEIPLPGPRRPIRPEMRDRSRR